MKRRLFLKSSTVGVGGVLVLPSIFYGCPNGGHHQDPFAGIDLFRESSVLFDSAIAELRLAGSGSLASAEAEDVTLAGTAEVDLVGVAEQITNQQAAEPAELAEDFAESSEMLLEASESIYQSAPELFNAEAELIEGAQAELAEDYAFLKVLKSTTILASAATATPLPIRKVTAAEKMIASAAEVHNAFNANAEIELIEGSEFLMGHAEEYVGAAEAWSAENAFVEGVHTYGEAADQFAETSELLLGGENLLVSSDNISLSTDYFAQGIDNLNAEAEIFNATELTSAAEMVPFSEFLVAEAETFESLAEGDSAEMGAAEMLGGASEILSDAETNVTNIGAGGEVLDLGADQFIAGTLTFVSAEKYTGLAQYYLKAAETLSGNPGGIAEAEAEAEIILTTELMHPASEIFQAGAEALQRIELTDGVESLVPATTEILTGAEHLESIASSPEAEIGAAEMIQWAEIAEAGAIESLKIPSEMHIGSEAVEIGSFGIKNGAAEFIEGYR